MLHAHIDIESIMPAARHDTTKRTVHRAVNEFRSATVCRIDRTLHTAELSSTRTSKVNTNKSSSLGDHCRSSLRSHDSIFFHCKWYFWFHASRRLLIFSRSWKKKKIRKWFECRRAGIHLIYYKKTKNRLTEYSVCARNNDWKENWAGKLRVFGANRKSERTTRTRVRKWKKKVRSTADSPVHADGMWSLFCAHLLAHSFTQRERSRSARSLDALHQRK